MVTVVLTIGAANILLGYALACYLRSVLDDPGENPSPAPDSAPPEEAPPASDDDDLLLERGVNEDIPSEWVDRLEVESVCAKSFVDAAAPVLRLEVGKYLEALNRLEDDVRAEGANAARLSRVIDRVIKLNGQWLALQVDASKHVQARADTVESFSDVAQELNSVLLRQQSQIESTCQELSQLDVIDDMLGAYRTLTDEFARLVELAHQLRDIIVDALLATMRAEGLVEEFDKGMHRDDVTGFHSKTGFEVAIQGWWEADPARNRLASAVLFDISGMCQFNRQFGTRFGDRLVEAAGALLDELLREERGFEIVARIHGQQFLVLFGDTGPRNATSGAERIRQSFADATFETDSDNVRVYLTCAVTEVQRGDDAPALLSRLNDTLDAAKAAGRNRTMLDDGDGPQPVDPPEYQISTRVIAIEDE